MRRLLIATLLGATLCTPAFAADASDTQPAAFVAMKAGVTMASIMAAESLWKNHHRFGAIGLMVASNLMMGVVAKHNAQVLSTLK